MITIPTAEQEAFRSSAPKTLTLNFSSGDPLTNEDIYMESLLLEQSICEESNLTFGMVYSSHFSVRIFDTGVSYTNQRVNPVLSVTVDGTTYTRSLGYYTVKSDRLTSDKLYRDLECYDYLVDVLQTDFTSWHNQMPSTYTLGQYRNAFFQRIGLAQSDFTDILDNMGLIRFKVDELSGATVISAILQAYGVFGYLGYDETHNDWRFKYVKPSKTPVLTIDDNSYVQGSLNYEDEPIRLISGVKILGWSEDYGEEGSTTIPDVMFGDNVGSMLTIEDNYLIHSLEENPRQSMCHGIYNNVNSFNYYPTSVETPVWIGIEPGDVIKIETDRKDIYFPVFKRTLKGISALKDDYEAQGEYELTANASAGGVSGTGTSIEQMRESMAELLAQKASIDAQDAAIQANIAANSALNQLSIIEDVAGTLRWISENGEFVLTEDTTVHPGTVYFIYENGEYVPITNPDTSKNPHEEGWYILDVTDSQASFIMAHLAVTNAGLWILPVDQLVSHQLVDSNDNDLIDSDGNLLVDYRKDEENIHQASGYKVLISGETTDNHPVGVSIYNNSGALIANYGATTTIGNALLRNVHIDSDAVYIRDGDKILAEYGDSIKLYEPDGETVAAEIDTGGIDVKRGKIGAFTLDEYGNLTNSTYQLRISNDGMDLNNSPANLHAQYTSRYMYVSSTSKNTGMDGTTIHVSDNQDGSTISEIHDGYITLYRSSGPSYVKVYQNTIQEACSLHVSAAGNRGLYDDNHSQWLIYKAVNTGNINILADNELYLYRDYQNGEGCYVSSNNNFRLIGSSTGNLGSNNKPWSAVYATDTTIHNSDKKLKDNIEDITFSEDLIRNLKPVTYMWKNGDHRRKRMGFIAQDVAEVCKDLDENLYLVRASYKSENGEDEPSKEYFGEDVNDELLIWNLSYEQLIAPMVCEIQRLMKRVDELETKIKEMEEIIHA